ncbi:Mitochondrial copper homeostasis protein [Rhinocladiella similis]
MAASAESDQAAGQDVNWNKENKAFQAKRTSEYYDPCQEAANKSIKCMNRNNGDRDMCQDYFQFVDHPSQPSEACLQNEPLMSHPRRQAGRADRIHEKQSLPGL